MNKVQNQYQVVLTQVYKGKKNKSFDKHDEKVKENTGSQAADGMDFAFFFPFLVLFKKQMHWSVQRKLRCSFASTSDSC